MEALLLYVLVTLLMLSVGAGALRHERLKGLREAQSVSGNTLRYNQFVAFLSKLEEIVDLELEEKGLDKPF